MQHMLKNNEGEQQAALASILSKGRVQVEALPTPVVSALRAAWQKVAARESSNPAFRGLLDSIRPFEKGG